LGLQPGLNSTDYSTRVTSHHSRWIHSMIRVVFPDMCCGLCTEAATGRATDQTFKIRRYMAEGWKWHQRCSVLCWKVSFSSNYCLSS